MFNIPGWQASSHVRRGQATHACIHICQLLRHTKPGKIRDGRLVEQPIHPNAVNKVSRTAPKMPQIACPSFLRHWWSRGRAWSQTARRARVPVLGNLSLEPVVWHGQAHGEAPSQPVQGPMRITDPEGLSSLSRLPMGRSTGKQLEKAQYFSTMFMRCGEWNPILCQCHQVLRLLTIFVNC